MVTRLTSSCALSVKDRVAKDFPRRGATTTHRAEYQSPEQRDRGVETARRGRDEGVETAGRGWDVGRIAGKSFIAPPCSGAFFEELR